MADDGAANALQERSQTSRARGRLTRRLADIVCLPETSVSPQERWMTADILDELLKSADLELKKKVATRLAKQAAAPRSLLLRLASDSFEVAEPILRWSQALSDFDMMELVPRVEHPHQVTLARREQISETVSAVLCHTGNTEAILALLRNEGARLSNQTIDFLVRQGIDDDVIARRLVKRPEMRPRQAFSLFWSVDHDLRRLVLERFAASRLILQEAAEDVFPIAANEGEQDAAVKEALAYIDRRQRNRALNDSSALGGLEGIIERAGREGLSVELRMQAADIVNIRLDLFNQIVDDTGGEAVAILAKATGLSRSHFEELIACAQHVDNETRLTQGNLIFDLVAVDKAQTVLRYWNWLSVRLNASN